MALSTAGISRQPVSSLLPPLIVAARASMGQDDYETVRPVLPASEVQMDEATFLQFDPLEVQSAVNRRRQPGALSFFSDKPEIGAAEQPIRIFAPRGVSSDAVPALSWLEARFSFDPLYVQNKAAALYALISRVPTSLAERRLAYDIFA